MAETEKQTLNKPIYIFIYIYVQAIKSEMEFEMDKLFSVIADEVAASFILMVCLSIVISRASHRGQNNFYI